MSLSYLHLQPGQSLPALDLPPFRVAVVVEAIVGMPWRIAVCDWLAEAGCMYLLAWGPDGTLWDDVMDETCVGRIVDGEEPEDYFIVTSWRDDCLLTEFFADCKRWSDHPDVDLQHTLLQHTLLLHIAAEPREGELRLAFEQT